MIQFFIFFIFFFSVKIFWDDLDFGWRQKKLKYFWGGQLTVKTDQFRD
jgi:hypothetical protein